MTYTHVPAQGSCPGWVETAWNWPPDHGRLLILSQQNTTMIKITEDSKFLQRKSILKSLTEPMQLLLLRGVLNGQKLIMGIFQKSSIFSFKFNCWLNFGISSLYINAFVHNTPYPDLCENSEVILFSVHCFSQKKKKRDRKIHTCWSRG